MYDFINTLGFARFLFDREDQAKKAARIMQAILEARSPRLSDISQRMPGRPAANYKEIQRFLDATDPRVALLRLFQEEAPFAIGDPTEMPRPQAHKTPYVGILKDGKTPGFWLLLLATPYRGRAVPFSFVTYSSRTIAEKADSRNLEHCRAFAGLKPLIGEKPLVLDREFSYLGLLENLVAEEVNFVIRLHLGSHPPTFINAEGRRIKLTVPRGKKRIYYQLYYKGKVAVNVIGVWRKGFQRPLWVMTNLSPEEGLAIYLARMKLEETLKDWKSLLLLDKVMNKLQENMEKMVALLLMSYTIGLPVGESIRDQMYGEHEGSEEATSSGDGSASRAKRRGKYWTLYSGLFVPLKQKILLASKVLREIIHAVQQAFAQLVLGDVRTPV